MVLAGAQQVLQLVAQLGEQQVQQRVVQAAGQPVQQLQNCWAELQQHLMGPQRWQEAESLELSEAVQGAALLCWLSRGVQGEGCGWVEGQLGLSGGCLWIAPGLQQCWNAPQHK